MKILVAGCSNTIDFVEKPWPAYLPGSVNLGVRGAGPDYVSKRVCRALTKSHYDYCVILWPYVTRVDLFVETEDTRKKAIDIAPWQKSRKRTFVDIDGLEVDQQGYVCSGHIRGYLSEYYRNFYSDTQNKINFWFYVLSVQLLCEKLGVKHLFFTVDDLKTYGTCMFDAVDLSKVESDSGVGYYNYLAGKNASTSDGYHYDTNGHRVYAKFVADKIKKHYKEDIKIQE